ncbi:MAG: ABC transporter permease [Pseudomonadota bacterium]
MDAFLRVFAILLADLRERTRTPRFWIVLGVMAYATWWCFPTHESGYAALSLPDGSRGLYSSAWAGLALSLIYSTLLNLIGFYLVRGTLTRDFETRVWQLLVTTPMTRAGFLFAKWASHMVVFAAIALVGAVVALAAQWVRAEDRHIDLIEAAKPLVLLSLPSLAMTAAFAIWFDLIPWLRRTAGNVLYFVLWATMLTLSLAPFEGEDTTPARGWIGDSGGMVSVAHQMAHIRSQQTGKPAEFGLNLGSARYDKPVDRFEWNTLPVDAKLLVGRSFWLVLSLILALAAAPLLDWAASRGLGRTTTAASAGRGLRWLDRTLDPFARGPLGVLTVAELKLALRQRRWWWWLAALGALGAQFGPAEGMRIAMLLAWVLPLDVLARGVLRDRDQGTGGLVFTAPRILPRLLAARFLVGVSMLCALSLPGLIRLGLDAPVAAAAALASIASIVSWGLSLGALCRNARPFELLMVCVVYVALNGANLFDLAQDPLSTLIVQSIGLLPAWLLLAWSWPRLARR